MSVPSYRRKDGQLTVIVKAQAFYVHISRSLKNEKKFDVLYWDTLTKTVIEKAQTAYLNLWRANNIRVQTQGDYQKRVSLQNEAKLDLLDIQGLLNPAKDIFHIPSKRVAFWTEGLTEVLRLISAWKKSDKDRYAKIKLEAG